MITKIPDGFSFSRTVPETIIPLRHRVLRAGLPIEDACWKEDRADGTCHFAAFLANPSSPLLPTGPAICCASFMRDEWRGALAYQLRGMATDEGYRGRGIGGALLLWCEDAIVLATPARRVWCNARISAIPFYLKHGWLIESAVFEIENAGPHRKMSKPL